MRVCVCVKYACARPVHGELVDEDDGVLRDVEAADRRVGDGAAGDTERRCGNERRNDQGTDE